MIRLRPPKFVILLCIAVAATASPAQSRRLITDTDLFKWSGSRFTLIEQSDNRPLYNLRDAKAVRAKLKNELKKKLKKTKGSIGHPRKVD